MNPRLTRHSAGPARKAAQAGELRRRGGGEADCSLAAIEPFVAPTRLVLTP